MTKENYFAIVFGIAVAVVVAFVWLYGQTGHMGKKNKPEQEVTEKEEQISSKMELSYEALSNTNYVSIEKVVRTMEIDEDGNCETTYDSYLLSDVSLIGNEDNTEDFTDCFIGTEYDDSKVKVGSFKDLFGFEFNGMTGKKLHDDLLTREGFESDFSECEIDEEAKKRTGENVYLIKDDISVFERLIPDDFSGEVLEKKAYFQTQKEGDKECPDYYLAYVRYENAGKTVERSVYLQVSVNDWEVK